MLNVVVQTIVRATMKAPAAAKTGLQRAASHSSNGNSRATTATITQGSRGKKIISPLNAASATSATTLSMISLRGGGSRTAETSPINSGATATMPGTLEVSQWYQMVRAGAVEPSTNTMPSVPPIAAAAVPAIAAATSPSTWRRLSRLKAEPKYRSIKPAMSRDLAGVTKGEDDGSPEVPVGQEI